jgi:hypothetical protein
MSAEKEKNLMWQKNRILWKASKHRLFERGCYEFSKLEPEVKNFIKTKIAENADPVVVFWKNKSNWTLIDSENIYSCHGGGEVTAKLQDTGGVVQIFYPESSDPEVIKTRAQFLLLPKLEVLIWVPPGPELFALMSILKMFPLSRSGLANNE